MAIEGQVPIVELIDRRFEGSVRLVIGLVEFIKRVRPTRGRGRCGEGGEGEHECDKGCETHSDDERVIERQGKANNELQGLNTLRVCPRLDLAAHRDGY